LNLQQVKSAQKFIDRKLKKIAPQRLRKAALIDQLLKTRKTKANTKQNN